MKALFFFRNNSDLDHITPVIYSLLKHGEDPSNITYCNLWPHPSLNNLNEDKRIEFLLNEGINVVYPAFFRLVIKVESWLLSSGKNFLALIVKKIYYCLPVRRTIDFFLQNFLTKRINNLTVHFNSEDRFVLDHGSSIQHEAVVSIARKKSCKTLSLPHGLMLHSGLKNKAHDSLIFSRSNPLNFYDQVIFPNEISESFGGQNHDVKRILGSARFSKEWIKELKNIYSVAEKEDEEKINVVVLAEKMGITQGKEYIPFIDAESMKQIVASLSNQKDLNIVIKHHPNILEVENESNPYFLKSATHKVGMKTTSSFELIYKADLVITTASSVILDAINLYRPIIFLYHVSSFDLIFKHYFDSQCTKNIKDFENLLDKAINGEFKVNLDQYDRFYLDIVESRGAPLKNYSKFITQ